MPKIRKLLAGLVLLCSVLIPVSAASATVHPLDPQRVNLHHWHGTSTALQQHTVQYSDFDYTVEWYWTPTYCSGDPTFQMQLVRSDGYVALQNIYYSNCQQYGVYDSKFLTTPKTMHINFKASDPGTWDVYVYYYPQR